MDPMAFTSMDITASDMESLIKKAKKKAKQARARVKKLQKDNPEANAKIQNAWKGMSSVMSRAAQSTMSLAESVPGVQNLLSLDEVPMESMGTHTSSLELEDEAVQQLHAQVQKEQAPSSKRHEETQQPAAHKNRREPAELEETQRRRLLELEEQHQAEQQRLEEMEEQQRLKELSWRMSTQAAVTAAVSGGRIEGELRMEVVHLREKLQKMEEQVVAEGEEVEGTAGGAGEDDEWDSDEDASPKVLTVESDASPRLLTMESVAVVHESSSEIASTTETTKFKNRPEPIFPDDLPSPEPEQSPEPLKTEVPLPPAPEQVPAVTVQVPLPPVRSEQPVLVPEPSEQSPGSNSGHRFTNESVRPSELRKYDSMDVAVEGMVQDAVEKMYNQFHESLSEDPINADMAGRKFSLSAGSQLCTPDPAFSAKDSPTLRVDPTNNPFVQNKDAQAGSAEEVLDTLHADEVARQSYSAPSDEVARKSYSAPSLEISPNDPDTPNSLAPYSDLNVTLAASQ
eukprot:gene13997-16544_t